jgi:hypothetical protein
MLKLFVMSLPKHFKLFLVLGTIFSLTLLVSPLLAQNTPPATTANIFLQKQQAIKDGSSQESWLDEGMGSNLITLFTGFVGQDTINQQFFDVFNATGMVPRTFPGGALGTGTKMVASLFTPPASGIEYIAGLKDNLLGKPAYAQGVGFQGLQFLLPLWRSFRNIVYVISSLIFIGIGIMIMLRIKISPQAVITIQSAVPQIITSLVLVTFSYAIAGLVIDLGNFILGLVVALFFSAQNISLSESLFPTWSWGSGFPILSDIGNGLAALWVELLGAFGVAKPLSFHFLANPDINTLNLLTFRALPGWIALVMLGGLLGSVVLGIFAGSVGNIILGGAGNGILSGIGGVLGGGLGGIVGGLLIPIILCIIVAIWLIKLYFGLITAYVTLIFKIIIGPLEIAFGAFPNSKMGFGSWFRDVVAQVAVFPIVTIVLIMINIIVDAVVGGLGNFGSGIGQPAVWAPGLINLGGNVSPAILGAAIGLAGLALLSKLPAMVPEFIFMIKPSPWGKAIGEGLDVKNMPVVGGVIRGTQQEAEKRIGGQVLDTGGQLATAAAVKAINIKTLIPPPPPPPPPKV